MSVGVLQDYKLEIYAPLIHFIMTRVVQSFKQSFGEKKNEKGKPFISLKK
jgi:hypothetical protein